MSKNHEFCIKNEELCIKNEKLCIKTEKLCTENDVIYSMGTYGFPLGKATADWVKYCELQYKCHFLSESSVENAEIMENCP